MCNAALALRDEEGLGMVEYGFLVEPVSLLCPLPFFLLPACFSCFSTPTFPENSSFFFLSQLHFGRGFFGR